MQIDGYMITASLDGGQLTLTAKSKVARAALFGPDSLARVADHYAEIADQQDKASGVDGPARPRLRHDGDSITIPVEQIASATMSEATMLKNGCLTVRTSDGREYKAHFRKKQASGFAELAKSLGI